MRPGDSSVDEIKGRLDVAEVIGEYLKLTPSGTHRSKALCPFHHEKTPSFMVSKDRQAWHCFGCGKGGDVFTFIQEIEGVEFPEALRILAKKANVELRSFNPELQTQKTRLLDALKLAAAFYRKVLTDAPAAEPARAYLRDRGLSEETLEDFQLGYSPDSWDALLTFLMKRGYQESDVFDAGLTVKRDKGTGSYDRFRGRIMFPIRDANGAVVGFGGRVLAASPDDPSTGAKYINTPETLVYRKGEVLYGLDRARQSIKQADLAILVEGYMDCLASHQAGVTNVAAVSGTALTPWQIKLLKRSTTNLALAFDADLAGGEAARRGIDLALAADLRVMVITLPEAKDPDELIRKDPGQWRNAIAGAQRIVDYAFDRALASADLSDVDVKKRIAAQLLPVIVRLPNPIEQSHYLQALAGKLGVDEGSLRDALKKAPVARRPDTPEPSRPSAKPHDRRTMVAERALAYGLFGGEAAFRSLTEQLEPELLSDPELQSLYRLALVQYSEEHVLHSERLQRAVASDLPLARQRFTRLQLMADDEFADLLQTEEGRTRAQHELFDGVRFLRRARIGEEVHSLEEQLRTAEQASRHDEADRLLRRMHELTEQLQSLER